jgi:hypothetical protein
MKQLSRIIENAHIYEGLLAAMEVCPKAVMSLFRWLSEAWHVAIKDLDFSALEVDVSWKNLDDAIKLTRKLGILYKIYHNEYMTLLVAPLQPEMKKIIINGAPAYLRLSLTTFLAHAQTLQDIVDFLKEVRNLETSNVVSSLLPLRPLIRFLLRPLLRASVGLYENWYPFSPLPHQNH